MVNTALSWENWLTEHEFSDDTADGPYVNIGCVIGVTEDKLRSPVVSGTYIGDIGLSKNELLCTSEVTQLKDVSLHVTKNVLRFDVSVANALGVNVGN